MGKIESNERFDIFSSRWLRGITENSQAELRGITEFVEFGAKEVVYSLGGPQDYLWGIARGQIRVLVALSAMEPVLGHIHHAGAWFGESEPIQTVGGLVEMRAITPTILGKVPYKAFRRLANAGPELWEALALLTSMNQLLAMSAANDLALRTSRKRIAAALLRLAGRRGVFQGTVSTNVVCASQQDIAYLGNVALSKATHHLGILAKEGFIGLGYGRIEIVDPEGLAKVADG